MQTNIQLLPGTVNAVGSVAESTKQVITTDLIYLGYGVAIVTVIVIVVSLGVKALANKAKHNNSRRYFGTPAE